MTAHLAAVDPMLPLPARVLDVTRESAEVVTLRIARPPGFAFHPGQFNMLFSFGRGEAAISMSGDPQDDRAIVHTIRAVGAVTRDLCRRASGDVIGLRGPFGTPWPMHAAAGRDLLLIAGGIGLAPLRPALYHALAHRERYGEITLLYGARTPEDRIFRDELRELRQRRGYRVLQTVDQAEPGWTGDVGVVTHLIARAAFDPAYTAALLCGPEVMMRFCARALLDRGVPADQVFVSMERNMKCAIGFCGHCQLGADFVCRDGPVFAYSRMARCFAIPEL